jgi:hypothetical protein
MHTRGSWARLRNETPALICLRNRVAGKPRYAKELDDEQNGGTMAEAATAGK